MKSRASVAESTVVHTTAAPPRRVDFVRVFDAARAIGVPFDGGPGEDLTIRRNWDVIDLAGMAVVRRAVLVERGLEPETRLILSIDESWLSPVPDDLVARQTPGPVGRDVTFGGGASVPRGTIIVDRDGFFEPLAVADDLAFVRGVLLRELPSLESLRPATVIVRGGVNRHALRWPAEIEPDAVVEALRLASITVHSATEDQK